jgi:signal transduction histidine kinase
LSAELESLAADRIGSDAAFSALDASGAPVFAATIEPPTIIYLNEAARAVYGGKDTACAALFNTRRPGGARLADLAQTMLSHGASPGPRIERIEFLVDDAPVNVAVLCRRLSDDRGPSIFVFSGLGLRGAAGAPETAEPAPDPDVRAFRNDLIARCGGETARFVWKTDAEGRFVAFSSTILPPADAVLHPFLGRTVFEIVEAYGLDAAFSSAFRCETSWCGVPADWPLFDEVGRVIGRAPATLGALPEWTAARRFAGFKGYGVLRLDTARMADASKARALHVAAPEDRHAANVVQLRPSIPPRDTGAPEPAVETIDERTMALSANERSAFDEIARTLGAVDARPAISTEKTDEPRPADDRPASADARAVAAALDLLPLPVLVARGARALFVNRALLDNLGCADRAAFEAKGGLPAFFAPFANDFCGDFPNDDPAVAIDARVEAIDWDGAPATMIAIRHGRREAPDQGRAPDDEEIRNTLARLRADNATLRSVVDALDGAVAVIGEDGRIASASAGFSTLFDVARGETDGVTLFSLFAPEDAPAIAARLAQAQPGHSEIFQVTTRIGNRSLEAAIGRLAVAETRLFMRLRAPVSGGASDELEAARRAAEAANAAKSAFLARISHEIRTPLNAIIGFAEIMIEERFGSIGQERYKDYLKDMRTSGVHVLSLVNDLLDLSKIEAGKMQLEFAAIDINAVIAECVSIMQPHADRDRVVIRQALAPAMPHIQADLRALRQILLNLLSNAVKFNQPGGQVIVSTGLAETGCLIIRIKDTGVGMSEEEVLAALEPFTQLAPENEARGTGLGLPLTRALVEASQASLTIKSRKREGTLVEIAFPLSTARAAE